MVAKIGAQKIPKAEAPGYNLEWIANANHSQLAGKRTPHKPKPAGRC